MISYSEKEIFTSRALECFDFATESVNLIPDDFIKEIRCHELARAIQRMINKLYLVLVDGRYAAVEHSWLMVDNFILDVYSVGSLPIVQLVSPSVPGIQIQYRAKNDFRDDINEDVVSLLISTMKGK